MPLGRLTCISGVSGSGKSSFVRGVLAPALFESVGARTTDFTIRSGRWRSVTGAGSVGEIVALDQAMPPPNRRSLVATYTAVFDDVRKVFGGSPAAKRDGLSASDLGVNAGHGRCQVCLGVGEVADGDLWSVCPSCGGSRYGQAALSIRIEGINIQELLDTPVERLCGWADTFRIPSRLVAAMCDLGIGYVALGRRIDTLSGGEVQRLRLAMRLATVSSKPMFFILDEPAVGLHSRDVRRLAAALERVLDGGRNTLVIVEHDLRLIQSADWVLEFGPGSGPDGGRIVFAGPPQRLARTKTSTGLALAGKLPAPNTSGRTQELAATKRKLPLAEQMARSTALIRTLISGDATTVLASDNGSAEPVVVVSERFWTDRDPWEVAGLDCELPKLLLDIQRPASRDIFAELLVQWERVRDGWLAIHPFLTDMQVWGGELPASLIDTISTRISREGLRLVTTRGDAVGKTFDVRQIRSTGARFVPADDSPDARRRALLDAFAVGARYVELRDRNGLLRATASDRLLDLEKAVVAPMVALPSHFSRHDSLGRCPMCKGRRTVNALPASLVIGNREATPDSERFLTPQANAVLKGVRRNALIPFLRRLAREGLWNLNISFERLDPAGRNLILYGFWSRPGPGSFLKSPKANPAEVAAWLRWDGLYRHLLDQADRSRDPEWARRVHESARAVRCLRCEGSGLQLFASLLRVGDVPFDDWTRLSDPARKFALLGGLGSHTLRQQRTRQRLLHCLAPVGRRRSEFTPEAVVRRAVGAFTTMMPAEPSENDIS